MVFGRGALGSRQRQLGLVLFLTVLFFYVLSASGHVQTIDVHQSLSVSQRLADSGQVWITGYPLTPGGGVVAGRGGHLYAAHDIGMSLIFLPISLFLRWGVLNANQADFLYPLVSPLFGALTVALFYAFQLRLTGNRAAAAAAAAVLGVATIVLPYAHMSFDAGPTAFFVLACVFQVHLALQTRSRWHLVLGGLGGCADLLLRVDSAILIGVVCVWLVVDQWRVDRRPHAAARFLVAWAVPMLAAVAVTLAYNLVRFGSALDNGHADDPATAFGTPLWHGLAGQLWSPGKGILFFAPPLLIALVGWRRFLRDERLLAAACLAGPLVYLLFHAKIVNWSGAEAWGPRFFVPAFPLVMLPLGLVLARWRSWALLQQAAVGLCIALGLAVQAPGVLMNDVAVDRMYGGTFHATAFDNSQIYYGWQAAVRGLRGEVPYPSSAEGGIVPAPVPRLDLWWLGAAPPAASHVGASRSIALLLGVLALGGAGVSIRLARGSATAPTGRPTLRAESLPEPARAR